MNHIEATIQCGTAREICAAIHNCENEAEYPRLGIGFDYDLAQGPLGAWHRSEWWEALEPHGDMSIEKIFDDLAKISRLCGLVIVTDSIEKELL